MKLIIFALLMIVVIVVAIVQKKKRDPKTTGEYPKPDAFYSLNDGNQTELRIRANVTAGWLAQTKEKYDWENFDSYDNRMWEYMYELFDKAVENNPNDHETLWRNLNREQKVFYAFLLFNGDTDNGGVYQFLFNKPEYIVAVAEMWVELKLDKISADYQKVLHKLSGKTTKISELKQVFNDDSQNWEKRWNSFADGYKELQSTDAIESYYYDDDFKKQLYKTVADYIEANLEKFNGW